MSNIIGDMVGSFNDMCRRQREVPGDVTVSLYTFNQNVKEELSFRDVIANPEPLTRVSASGNTALFDGIGRAVSETGAKIAEMSEDQRPSKVICVILTDGYENASCEYTRDRVRAMLEHQQGVYSWEVMFLGANIDVVAESQSIGVANSISYTADSAGITRGFTEATKGILRSRSSV